MNPQNFNDTKNCLKDLISTAAQSKSFTFQRSLPFGSTEQFSIQNWNPANIIYDDFMYTDKLTKKTIRMRDAKTSYEKGRHFRKSSNLEQTCVNLNQQKKKRQSRVARHNSNSDLEKQLTDLNECFVMLKSTEMFKLNSLRQKIFRSVDRSPKAAASDMPRQSKKNVDIQGDIKDMLLKKKKIRQILQDSVKQANIKEFRKYFDDKDHKVNHKIVSMNRHIPRSFNKSNIEKIISTLVRAQNKQENNCTFIKKSMEDVEFPGEQKLKSDLIEYMKKQIKQNGEYLVTPQKNKLLYQRLYHNVILKSREFDRDSEKNFIENQIDNSANNTFDDDFVASKVQIDISAQENILMPIVNYSQKSSTFLQKENFQKKINIVQKQKKSHNTYNQKKQRQHKKENTCINFTQNPNLNYNPSNKSSKIASFLEDFSFSPCQKSREISMIKAKFQRNRRLKTHKLSLKEQRFLFMVDNGLLFDVQKEILLNQDYLFIKDQNEDNLLHICAKNHFSEMFGFIIERYRKCGLKKEITDKWGEDILKDKLLEKNKNNKNVLEVAKLYQAQEIIQNLMRLKEQMRLREYNL